MPGVFNQLHPQAEGLAHGIGVLGGNAGSAGADVDQLAGLRGVEPGVLHGVDVGGGAQGIPDALSQVFIGLDQPVPQHALHDGGPDNLRLHKNWVYLVVIAADPHRAARLQHRKAHHSGNPVNHQLHGVNAPQLAVNQHRIIILHDFDGHSRVKRGDNLCAYHLVLRLLLNLLGGVPRTVQRRLNHRYQTHHNTPQHDSQMGALPAAH